MRILFSETNRLTQDIRDIEYPDALKRIETDNKLFELIELYNQNAFIRVYFDIDCYQTENPLENVLEIINNHFQTSNEDWAICDGSREGKWSYHILSRKYKITIRKLRHILMKCNKMNPSFDYSCICISMQSIDENTFLRFPNQSKDSIQGKYGPPMKVIQGNLSDFFVTQTENLEEWKI